jgi:hypothetical protein
MATADQDRAFRLQEIVEWFESLTSDVTVPIDDAKQLASDLRASEKAATVANSNAAFYAKTLIKLRNTLIGVTTDIQDEGDRAYFGSTNDADRLKAIARKLDDLAWDEIMADSQPPMNLYDSIERLSAEVVQLRSDCEWADSQRADNLEWAKRAEAERSEVMACRDGLMLAITPFMPITTRDNQDYAEVTFGDHQSQAMTMSPAKWIALSEVYAATLKAITDEAAK